MNDVKVRHYIALLLSVKCLLATFKTHSYLLNKMYPGGICMILYQPVPLDLQYALYIVMGASYDFREVCVNCDTLCSVYKVILF